LLGRSQQIKRHSFAANLAPFLYKLKTDFISDYQNIVSAVQTVAPYFQDFDFNIEGENILLRWQKKVFEYSTILSTLCFIELSSLLLVISLV
jgi:hypothetical protein